MQKGSTRYVPNDAATCGSIEASVHKSPSVVLSQIGHELAIVNGGLNPVAVLLFFASGADKFMSRSRGETRRTVHAALLGGFINGVQQPTL